MRCSSRPRDKMAVTCTVVTTLARTMIGQRTSPLPPRLRALHGEGHVVRATPLFAVVPHTKNCQQPQEDRPRQNLKRSEPGKLTNLRSRRPTATNNNWSQTSTRAAASIEYEPPWVELFAISARGVDPFSVSTVQSIANRRRCEHTLDFTNINAQDSCQHALEQGPGQVPQPRLRRATWLRARSSPRDRPRCWSVFRLHTAALESERLEEECGLTMDFLQVEVLPSLR